MNQEATHQHKTRLAIFASGGGSNAGAIMHHFQEHASAEVVLVCSNNKQAGVFERAASFGIKALHLPRSVYSDSQALIALMKEHHIDLVVLAGYMKLVPPGFTRAFHRRILNIHPGLLPEFGGKGMYGTHVHEAVINSGTAWSGITIHFVDEEYDHGPTIFQHAIPVQSSWDAKALAAAVLKQEHHWYPRVVEMVVKQQK
ncbi:MAG: phosphoribosylglycinamide formyltransferase [Bacteroidia bacterium]